MSSNRNNRRNRRNKRDEPPTLAGLAMDGVQRIMRLINIEQKYLVSASAGTAVTFNGVLQDLCSPAQGAAFNQRIGDSIKMQKVELRGSIYLGAAACTVRAMLVLDKSNQAAAGSDILSGAGNVYAPQSAIVNQYEQRYHVLADTAHHTLTINGDQSLDFTFVVNQETLAKMNAEGHILFSPGTTTITTNSLKLVLISSLSASTPTCYYYSKVYYTDD